MKYPCTSCTKVNDPKDCERKHCRLWGAWFVRRWDELRAPLYDMLKNKVSRTEERK